MNDITFVGRHTTVFNVAQHEHDSWEYVYCTAGGGVFHFPDSSLSYKRGDVVIIPPGIPHSNESAQGFNNLHVNMESPILTLKEPTVIVDDSNQFLLQAFSAAFYHFYSDRKERTSLLSAYGNLISYYLIAYQTGNPRSGIVDEIEHSIINHYSDCDYKLDDYLESLPFSCDYLRKLFHKSINGCDGLFLCLAGQIHALRVNTGLDGLLALCLHGHAKAHCQAQHKRRVTTFSQNFLHQLIPFKHFCPNPICQSKQAFSCCH